LQESPRLVREREKGFGSHLNSAAGHRVTFAGQYGDIMSIGLRSVKLRVMDTFRADNIRPPVILHRQVYADWAAAMPASGIGGQAS
jgi:hypothetical protein